MPEYIVKEPLRYDGEQYAPGDTVEMTAKQAGELIDIGVLEAGAKGKASTAAAKDLVGGDKGEPRANAKDTIAKVKAAATIEELDELAKGEDRSSVLDAIAARRKELGA